MTRATSLSFSSAWMTGQAKRLDSNQRQTAAGATARTMAAPGESDNRGRDSNQNAKLISRTQKNHPRTVLANAWQMAKIVRVRSQIRFEKAFSCRGLLVSAVGIEPTTL